MRELQARIIRNLNTKPTVDPPAEIETRVGFLVDYVRATGANGLVLGISGGQDSSLAGRLCQLAVERLTGDNYAAEFVAMRLPYGVQQDEDDAQLALSFIAPQRVVDFNIRRGVDGVAAEYLDAVGDELSDYTKGNAKARTRMIAQYALAGQRHLLVVGADHAAEAITGFYTKYGDGGADLIPLAGLTKRQGKALLVELGAPERLYTKPPTADLLDAAPGQSDETELGLRYDDIDDFLEGKTVPDLVAAAIEARYLITEHKRRMPPGPSDSWWR